MILRRLSAVLALIFVAALCPDPSAAQSSLGRSWEVRWINPGGHVYHGVMRLDTDSSGVIEGQSTWKLVRSPRDVEQAKLGITGVEFIRGKYDAANGLVLLEGYRKDDPNSVIGLDRYRLVVTPNGSAIGGPTDNNGSWRGVFWAYPAPDR